MTSPRSVVFANPARTAIGTFGGSLKEIAAPNLGAAAIKAAIERAGLKPDEVGTVAMGNVIQAGTKVNPARQAAIHGGLAPNGSAVFRVLPWFSTSAERLSRSRRTGDSQIWKDATKLVGWSLALTDLLRAKWGVPVPNEKGIHIIANIGARQRNRSH